MKCGTCNMCRKTDAGSCEFRLFPNGFFYPPGPDTTCEKCGCPGSNHQDDEPPAIADQRQASLFD